MQSLLNSHHILPTDSDAALLLGRVWDPETCGPTPVLVSGNHLLDVSAIAPTLSLILESEEVVKRLRQADDFPVLCSLSGALANSDSSTRDVEQFFLLAPNDLQAIKASGVTFVASMLERVIEERARGDHEKAAEIREQFRAIIGDDLSSIVPGSPEAMELKQYLESKGEWSQYLEVGIGPDAEIFTKSQPLSAVGIGAEVGLHPMSSWNNPEPEVVLAVNSQGDILGASLGNDVNLRDVEGRSALLLGKAKDNNGSCSIGPFIRLFDDNFTLEDVKKADIHLHIAGEDGFEVEGVSSMSLISRSPESLVNQAIGPNHQYPDGLMLFLGTMFAPVQDRDGEGMGFTHHLGDWVAVSTPKLGCLINKVNYSNEIPPWTFGITSLMQNLSNRNLL